MRRMLIAGALFLAGIVFCFVLIHSPMIAQGADSGSDIIFKLDELAKGQQELMTAINSIKEDLQIIKIRITQMQ